MGILMHSRDQTPPPTPKEKTRYRTHCPTLLERPGSEMDCSDIPEITDFSRFTTVKEVKAYKATRRKQAIRI